MGLDANPKAVYKSYQKGETKAVMGDQESLFRRWAIGRLYEAGSSWNRPWNMVILWIHKDREQGILSTKKGMSILM